MAIYAIGDLQGCYDELRALLDQIHFRADRDRLWFVGDLVNRGPKSLESLRFVHDLGDNAVTVLGNHDLHLLAAAEGGRRPGPKDNFHDVLAAPDRDALVDWLRLRPLLHHDPELDFLMIHAGLAPTWTPADAAGHAREIETVLAGDDFRSFLARMYGDRPDCWSDDLTGIERLRVILNCFTRLRMCDPSGRMQLDEKGGPWQRDDDLVPWFEVPGRASSDTRIVFGHWSALGRYAGANVWALDSGCVWGQSLTALRLDGEIPEWFSVPC